MSNNVIEHRGRIEAIKGNCIKVHFISMSACSNCHARSVCSASGMEKKEVEIIGDSRHSQVGEEVKVLLRQSMGFKALFYGYVLPFFLLVTALFLFSAIFQHEVVAGLLSLGMLLPYYLLVYHSKDHFQRTLTFDLKKLNHTST